MKLKKAEITVIAVTLALLCFTAGYFTGRNTAVNVITVETGQSGPSAAPEHTKPAEVSGKSSGAEASAETYAESPSEEIPAIVNETPSPSEDPPSAEGASDKININVAAAAELISLPGIGEVLAQRIIDYRKEHGAFQTIEEIKDVSGIGDAKFNAMKDMITVG
jgi:competence protein ComEA